MKPIVISNNLAVDLQLRPVHGTEQEDIIIVPGDGYKTFIDQAKLLTRSNRIFARLLI